MANSTTEPAPPRDSVWTKYSPNHEFPVASVASVAAHGLIVAAVFWFGWILNARWHGEPSAPPAVTVAYVIDGKSDDRIPGGSGSAGGPGALTEQVDSKEPVKNSTELPIPTLPSPDLPPTPPLDFRLDVPTIGESNTLANLDKQFDTIAKDLKVGDPPRKTNVGPKGIGNDKDGKGQGKGTGTGTGTGVGPGTGPNSSGMPSEAATRAEILAKRWQFNPSGSPREHVQKLMAMGVRLGFHDRSGQFWLINELKVRPVTMKVEPYDKYKDTVKWFNRDPRSVAGLAAELRIPGPPPLHFVLLLPQDQEQKLADIELKFAKARNRDLNQVTETWFEFPIVGGTAAPFVTGQVPFEPRPRFN